MAVAAIDFRTRRTRELFCCFVHGAGRLLPAVVVDCYAFEDFGELSDDLELWERLQSRSQAHSLHFPVREPEAHGSS